MRSADAVVEELRGRGELWEAAPGLVGLRGDALRLLQALERAIAAACAPTSAAEWRMPAGLTLERLARADYFASFPQWLTAASHLSGDEAALGRVARAADPAAAARRALAPADADRGGRSVERDVRWGDVDPRRALARPDTILAVGGRPTPTRNTYQARYAEVLGRPTSLLQVLALTQVFERRMFRHFHDHLRRPGTHPAVRFTLRRMIDEKKNHLSWVKCWLDRQTEVRGEQVEALMRRYAEADERVYASLTAELGWRMAA